MYDLDNVARDFPWTAVPDGGAPVELWRAPESNWFSEIPPGWGDVIEKYLKRLDKLVKRNNWNIYVAQVKEKFGTLRFYVDILGDDSFPQYSDENPDIRAFYDIIHEMEAETGEVCCDCGTRDDVKCYGGWIHYACPTCEKKRIEEYNRRMEEYKASKEQK